MKRGSVAPQFRTAHEIGSRIGSRAERDDEERGLERGNVRSKVPARGGVVNIETNVDFDRKRTRNWRKRWEHIMVHSR